ncbi:MAG: hypothetical protein WBW75_04640 [Mycobacterium sp.]|uniref:hypothetical protein n=1 Tax=Mycobacterium sp. TaxID=1785 RepID=UPI003C3A091B
MRRGPPGEPRSPARASRLWCGSWHVTQDITLEDLTAACADFMRRTGWDDGGELTAELAADMASLAVRAADGYPPGTQLRPSFSHASECWTLC